MATEGCVLPMNIPWRKDAFYPESRPGWGDKYTNVRIGINGRLDTIQAAVLLAKMELFLKN